MTRMRPRSPPPASLLGSSVSRLTLVPRRSCSDIEPQVIKTAYRVRNRSSPKNAGTYNCQARYTKAGQCGSSDPMECFRSDTQPGACPCAQCCAHIALGGVSVQGSRPSSRQTLSQNISAAKRMEYRATSLSSVQLRNLDLRECPPTIGECAKSQAPCSGLWLLW